MADGVSVDMSFSPSLLECAFSELYLSLEERRKDVVRLRNNHYSWHAVGSIVLLVTGFDSFLNEGIRDTHIKGILELADISIMNKYYGIIRNLEGSIQQNNDLDILIKLRNEMVHYLPRNVSGAGARRYLPEVLYCLDRKGLLFNFPDCSESYEIPFSNMVCSYRLAYWAWETVDLAVSNLIHAFSSTNRPDLHYYYSGLYPNFKTYQKIISSDNLGFYDEQNGLRLTFSAT